MADWDANSPRLTENLVGVLRRVRAAAFRRDAPSLEDARVWRRDMMAGLRVPHPLHVGRFRGEAGLETYRVRVGANKGVAPADVGGALARFEQTLQSAVAALDERYPSGQELDADGLAAVIDLCGWAHAEWIRIHPFANGNGRTARRSQRRTPRPVLRGASRLTLRGGSVRFFSGDDLSEGQRGSYSARRLEPSLETSIVCGVR